MSRVDTLDHQIRMALHDEGRRDVLPAEIYQAIYDAEVEIAERALLLKSSQDLTLVAGQRGYGMEEEIYRLREFIEPSTWTKRLEVIQTPEMWAKFSRLELTVSQPLYAFVWGRILYFHPTPTTADTLTILSYRIPSEDVEAGGDLEIPRIWDLAVRFHAVAALLKDPPSSDRYRGLFELEMKKHTARADREHAGAVRLNDHSSRDIGF